MTKELDIYKETTIARKQNLNLQFYDGNNGIKNINNIINGRNSTFLKFRTRNVRAINGK